MEPSGNKLGYTGKEKQNTGKTNKKKNKKDTNKINLIALEMKDLDNLTRESLRENCKANPCRSQLNQTFTPWSQSHTRRRCFAEHKSAKSVFSQEHDLLK